MGQAAVVSLALAVLGVPALREQVPAAGLVRPKEPSATARPLPEAALEQDPEQEPEPAAAAAAAAAR